MQVQLKWNFIQSLDSINNEVSSSVDIRRHAVSKCGWEIDYPNGF